MKSDLVTVKKLNLKKIKMLVS